MRRFITLAAILFVAPLLEAQDTPALPTAHTKRDLEGWTVHVDDRLLSGARVARRGTLAVALATRMVPMLERDAAGLVEALRGRGVVVEGLHARAQLLSPLLAGSLERGLSLAEAMEARGYGRPGGTRLPAPAWRALDLACVVVAPVLAVAGALWL